MIVYIGFFTLINLVLWLILFVRLKKEFAPAVVLREIRFEVEKLIIEINKEVDQDISLIEARRSGLKELLEKIDERILLIDKKIGLIDQEKIMFQEEQKILEKLNPQSAYIKNKTKLQKNDLPLLSETKQDEEQKKHGEEVKSMFSSDERDSEIFLQGRVDKAKNPEEPIQISFSKNPINQVQAIKDRVISLALHGKDATEIADALKMPVREVSFILALHSGS